MYINFPLAKSKGLTLIDIILLQMIHQNKSEDHSEILEVYKEELEYFEAQGLTKLIKGTKKDTNAKLVRLSEKGAKTLEEIQVPVVNSDDLDVYEWLEKVYKSSGKDIGNAKKTKSLIAQFRVHSGIERNHLAFLCKIFINDEKEMEWSKKLEYLFWKPSHVFETRFELDQSRLYQYYLKRKEAFDAKFETIQN